MEKKLEQLIEENGKEKVLEGLEKLLNQQIEKKVPLGYAGILQPEKLQSSIDLIDAQITDVSDAGAALEEAYGELGSLKKELTKVETSIKIDEATAFMNVGADNSVSIDGKTIKLSNNEMRDQYKRYVTKEQRQEKARIEGEIQQLEVGLQQAKDRQAEAKEVADLIKAKAYAQANLLKFLS
jgi:hypothetical protein